MKQSLVTLETIALVMMLSIGACAGAADSSQRMSADNTPLQHVDSEHGCAGLSPQQIANLTFDDSPGGVPEVSVSWVAEHGCGVRVVDVRESNETGRGHIEGAERISMLNIAQQARLWDPRAPVVLVCRSGRRSARVVETLESMGFTRVASMTGGMLRWVDHALPLQVPAPITPVVRSAPLAGPRPLLDIAQFGALLEAEHIPEVRVASLLLQSSEACVDGRETHAVIGAPGGDAGELLLALAAIESVAGRDLSDAEITSVFNAHIEGFGRFYMHTDDHAMHALRHTLRVDPRFNAVTAVDEDDTAFEAFLRTPPRGLRPALLELLVEAENIGCGHLKLIALHPEQYGVRPALTARLVSLVFHELWGHPDHISFVVLHGEHQEEAVVNVRVGHDARASTNVPAIPPRLAGRSFFVNHPEVSQYIRREHAAFLRNELPWLAGVVNEHQFELALSELADVQLSVTVAYLAQTLPIFDVHFTSEGVVVEEVRPRGPHIPRASQTAE